MVLKESSQMSSTESNPLSGSRGGGFSAYLLRDRTTGVCGNKLPDSEKDLLSRGGTQAFESSL